MITETRFDTLNHINPQINLRITGFTSFTLAVLYLKLCILRTFGYVYKGEIVNDSLQLKLKVEVLLLYGTCIYKSTFLCVVHWTWIPKQTIMHGVRPEAQSVGSWHKDRTDDSVSLYIYTYIPAVCWVYQCSSVHLKVRSLLYCVWILILTYIYYNRVHIRTRVPVAFSVVLYMNYIFSHPGEQRCLKVKL